MKTIKLIILGILTLLISSCENHTCTSGYIGSIMITGKNDEAVSIKYIGPQRRDYRYKKEFGFKTENKLPFFHIDFAAFTFCDTKDFKKKKYNFLEITNTSSDSVCIYATILGEEAPSTGKISREVEDLLHIYNEQDKNPDYDYKEDPRYKNVDYLSREDLYKKLIEEKYPYVIKLAPGKTCIMKWGGLGFQLIN